MTMHALPLEVTVLIPLQQQHMVRNVRIVDKDKKFLITVFIQLQDNVDQNDHRYKGI